MLRASVCHYPYSEIGEGQCLKRIPDLVRSRTVLLRLGRDKSCPTIGPVVILE